MHESDTISMKEKSIKLNALLNSIKKVSSICFFMISIPYVTRVLGKSNFGKVSFTNSIVNYFVLFAALGITNYTAREGAVLRGNKEDFNRFANEVFSINVFSSIISYVLIGIVILFPRFYGYRALVVIQSLAIVCNTFGADWVNTIFEDFGYITLRTLVAQILALICMFRFVRTPDDYAVYAVILLMSNTGANLFNIWYIRKYVRLKFTLHLQLRKHLKPLVLLFANILAVTIYINSDITLLGFFKSDSQVGVYTLSSKIYSVVKEVINATIMVMIPRLSLYYGKGEHSKFIYILDNVLNFLICIIMPVLVGLMLLSDRAMLIAGGTDYIEGYHSLQILSIALFFAVLACFFSNCILLPAKLDAMFLKSTLAGAITNLLTNFVAIPLWGMNGAALTTLLAETIVFLLSFYESRKVVRCSIRRNTWLSAITGCIGITIICYAARRCITTVWVSVVVSLLLSCAYYIFVMRFLNKEFFKLFKH